MILDLVRGSGLSAWLMEEITGGASGDPTPALDRLRRYQEELAAAIVDYLRDLAVPAKAARKWLQIARGQTAPPAATVEEARRHLEAFVRGILPQLLSDPRELRDCSVSDVSRCPTVEMRERRARMDRREEVPGAPGGGEGAPAVAG